MSEGRVCGIYCYKMVCTAGGMKDSERDGNSSGAVVADCCNSSSDPGFPSNSYCSILYLLNSVLFSSYYLSIFILSSSSHIIVMILLEMGKPFRHVSGTPMSFLTCSVLAVLYKSYFF